MSSLHLCSANTDECSSIQTYSESSVMYIHLNVMTHNLKKFREVVSPTTKMMMIVKASAYGVGAERIGQWSEKTQMIDYFGVVYVAEGIQLRKATITLPIMVINIYNTDFNARRVFNLEPVIYSISLLNQLVKWLNENNTGNFN